MKTFLEFLKYNNAVPFILFALILGAGTVLAASPTLRNRAFAPDTAPVSIAPVITDTSRLLEENMKTFDLALRIDALTEDARGYAVSYSYRTLAVVDDAWQEVRQSGKMDIPKALLGKRDLKTYLIEQIGQVMDREIAYLREAQAAVRPVTSPKPSAKYAALVGSEVTKNDVLSTRNDATADDSSKKEARPSRDTGMTVETAGGVVGTVLSKEEIEKIIVAAVAEFLAVDTSMPSLPSVVEPSASEEEQPPVSDELPPVSEIPEEPASEEESSLAP